MYTHQPESQWASSQSFPPSSHTQVPIHPKTPEQPARDAVPSSPSLSPLSSHPAVPEEPACDAAPSPQQTFVLCSPPLDVLPCDDKISILFIPEPAYSISSLKGEPGASPSYYKAHLPWMSLPARTHNILANWVVVKGPASKDTGLVPVLIHEYVSLASPFPIMTDTQQVHVFLLLPEDRFEKTVLTWDAFHKAVVTQDLATFKGFEVILLPSLSENIWYVISIDTYHPLIIS